MANMYGRMPKVLSFFYLDNTLNIFKESKNGDEQQFVMRWREKNGCFIQFVVFERNRITSSSLTHLYIQWSFHWNRCVQFANGYILDRYHSFSAFVCGKKTISLNVPINIYIPIKSVSLCCWVCSDFVCFGTSIGSHIKQ